MVEGDFETVVSHDLKEAEAYLDGVQSAFEAPSRRVIRDGRPAETILAVAEEQEASLIAMSTHGRTGLSRWLFGSVAEEVLRSAPVPLLLTRSFPRPGADAIPRRILVPIDSGELSLLGVDPAIELATTFAAHVVLLHVMPDHPPYGEPVYPVREAFDRFRTAGLTVEPVLRRGDAAAEILSVARDQKVELIAMATHGRTGVSRFVEGSVAEKVTRGSDVPLLLVRVPSRAAEAKAG
jgi:nucleotide-binding universal stress UspA family protein